MGALGWVDFRDPKHLLAGDPSLYPPGYDEEMDSNPQGNRKGDTVLRVL